MNTQLPPGGALGLSALLAGAAAVVMGTAAALSVRAATRPELPPARWYRPLPPAVSAAIDRAVTPAALRALALVVVAVLLGALATADGPVRGGVLVAAITAASLIAGPLLSEDDPAHSVEGGSTPASNRSAAGVGWPAVVWLVGLSLLVLTVDDGRVLAACLAGYGLAQIGMTRRQAPAGRTRHDAVAALAVVCAPLAPLDRMRDGRLAWRNPVVSAAHATPGPATVWLTAVVAALALTGARVDETWPPLATVTLFALSAAVSGAVLRAGIIRPFFVGAAAPLAAAYGLQAGGPWLRPVDLLTFVALHAAAMAVLHRQAIARHDPRTARAVQFPARLAIVTSVLAGLAVFTTA